MLQTEINKNYFVSGKRENGGVKERGREGWTKKSNFLVFDC